MNTKKILAMVIALAMIVAIVPTFGLVASAAEDADWTFEAFGNLGGQDTAQFKQIGPVSGTVEVEFDLTWGAEAGWGDDWIGLGTTAQNAAPTFSQSAIGIHINKDNGVLRFHNGSSQIDDGSFAIEKGKTYNFAIVTDTKAHTWSVVVKDGETEIANVADLGYRATQDTIDRFMALTNNGAGADRFTISELHIHWTAGYAYKTVKTTVNGEAYGDAVTTKVIPGTVTEAAAASITVDGVEYYLDEAASTLSADVAEGETAELVAAYKNGQTVTVSLVDAEGNEVGTYEYEAAAIPEKVTVPAGIYGGQYYLDAAVEVAVGETVTVAPLTMFTWNNDANVAAVVEGTYNYANVVSWGANRTGYAYIDASEIAADANVQVTLTGRFNEGENNMSTDVSVSAVKGLKDVDLAAGEKATAALAEKAEGLLSVSFGKENVTAEDTSDAYLRANDVVVTVNIGKLPEGTDALAFKANNNGIFVIKAIEVEATEAPLDLVAPALGWDDEDEVFTIDFAYASANTAGTAINVYGLVEGEVAQIATATLDGAVGAAFVVGDTNAQYAATSVNGTTEGNRTAVVSVYGLVMEAVASAQIDGQIEEAQLAAVNKVLAAGGIFVKEDGSLTAEAAKVLVIDGATVKINEKAAGLGLAFTAAKAGGKYTEATLNDDGTVTLAGESAETEEIVVYLEEVEFVLEASEVVADEAVSGELDFIEEV
ncbi:MAG: hypothetical protein J1F63_03880 [Oscillospiraceae bacterium]|nr:hypothetical protein [Oscillospiraceae bacterium]